MPGSYAKATEAFLADDGHGWTDGLSEGGRRRVVAAAQAADRAVAGGETVLPPPSQVFRALAIVRPPDVRAVMLGQDPYPTPGHAEGLAFSVAPGVAIPRSLANIFRELHEDIGCPLPANGSLSGWAAEGVLLLNPCLTVQAGQAGSHRRLGWQALTRHVIAVAGGAAAPPCVFLLWGNDAEACRDLIDPARHHVIASAHPSPLSARRGFFGSRPFSRANEFLTAQGRGAIDWNRTALQPSSG
jgi:uracil-DNA glycosylase